jgi:CheY-like chemotaxis protein
MASDVDLHEVRILIVDDDRDSRALLTAMLSLASLDVVAVARTGEALSELASSRFDLLISDLGLPGRSGYDLIRIVRSLNPPTSTIPAIAVTGYAMHSDRERVLRAGFQAHVGKPVDQHDLLHAIRVVLPHSRSESARGSSSATAEG